MTVDKRFDAKWTPEPMTGCYLWLAHLQSGGYGTFWHGNRKVYAHRFAYERRSGTIPDGLVIDHICRNRACCNPDHLRAVTQRDNTLAPGSRSEPAIHVKKTHCKHGHEYTPANTRKYRGKRYCRACKRARDRARSPLRRKGLMR